MKVTIDREKCMKAGMCTNIAPNVFKFDIKDRVATLKILQVEIPDEELEVVQAAVASCPGQCFAA